MTAETPQTSLLRKILPFPDLTSLGLRDYRLWWIGSSATVLNQFGMQMIIAWWVQRELDSPALVGTIILFFGLPSFIFLLPAGLVADRWDRRKQLMAAQTAALISALLLGVLMAVDVVIFPIAAAFAFVSGVTVAFSNPARQALIPMMVPRRLLQNGIVLGSLSMNVSRMVAPFIAAVLMAAFGFAEALFFVSAFLLVGVLTLSRMRIPHFAEDDEPPQPAPAPQGGPASVAAGVGAQAGPQGAGGPGAAAQPAGGPAAAAGAGGAKPRESVLQNLIGGFQFLLNNRPLFVLMGLYMATGLFIVGPMQALIPVLIDKHWGQDATSLGYAFMLQALTGFITGLYLTRMGGLSNKGGMFACAMMGGGGSYLLFSISPEFLIGIVFFGTFGVAASFYSNMSQTILQSNTPRPLMGRVLSIYQLSISGLLPIGAFLGGLVAEGIGAPLTGLIGGGIGFLMAASALVFARDFRRLT